MRDLKELTERQCRQYANAWREKLKQTDPAQRTLGLHDVMMEVGKLCGSYTEESVDAALGEIYSVPLTRRRLRRLSRIPRRKLEVAMLRFEKSITSSDTHAGTSQVLTTSHLEALARCIDQQLQLTLLSECAANGWNATTLRKEVAKRQSASPVRPLKLVKQIRINADALIEAMKKVDAATFVVAVDKVKQRDRESFRIELEMAIVSLRRLRENADSHIPILVSAMAKIGLGP